MTRRGVQQVEVWVDGLPMSNIAPRWSGLKTATRTNGDWQASWTVVLKSHQRPPALRYGARVDVKLGPLVLWVGTLTEPNWDSGEMTAIGAFREGESTPALTGAGVATTKPNTAIDAAIARGVVSWNRVGGFGTTPVGDADDQGGIYTVNSILDAWAEENLSGWRIDRNRNLIIATPTETDPAWFVVPGSGVLGSADDERADRIFVRYVASTNGRLATASYPAASIVGGVEPTMDITDRGRMTATKATNIAQAEWEKLRGRSGWTNGLTLTAGQVTTPGSIRANLALIRAGQANRLLGVPDTRGLASNTDVIIGDTEYDWEADTVQVNPVGLAARDPESALEQAGQIAASAAKKAATTSALLADAAHSERTRSAGQSLANNTSVTVLWTQSVVPERGGLAYAAGVFTVGQAGRYAVSPTAQFDVNATGRRLLRLVVNGANRDLMNMSAPNAGQGILNGTEELDLSAGDTISVQVLQNSGGSLDLLASSRITISSIPG